MAKVTKVAGCEYFPHPATRTIATIILCFTFNNLSCNMISKIAEPNSDEFFVIFFTIALDFPCPGNNILMETKLSPYLSINAASQGRGHLTRTAGQSV